MQVTLTIIRYPRHYSAIALFAMALHRLPLWLNNKISFYKLLGCGKNGTFDKRPDWQQWGILTVQENPSAIDIQDNSSLIRRLYGPFIYHWMQFFNCETWTVFLEPLEGHGSWDGKEVFGQLPKQSSYDGPLAVLTRATIRLSKLSSFWKNVDGVAAQMLTAKGLITSVGVGEIPFIKQATFSVWENKEAMKNFAYQMREHTEVIRKTKAENWYSEDMFVRFIPLKTSGTIKGIDPLKGKL